MSKCQIKLMQIQIEEQTKARKKLKDLDFFVLDNSLRESTVGQLRGHTIENKWKIYEEVKKVGFKHMIVASFSHMTRLGDTFIQQLQEKGEDFTNLWAFTELVESIGRDKVPDCETIPVGLRKMKLLGIRNAIIEVDLVYKAIDYDKFDVSTICKLFSKRLQWIRENLASDAKVLINLRDFSDAMVKAPERQFAVINYVSSLPEKERPFGLIYEETGKYLPEEVGIWTAAVRKEMDKCGFQSGHLLAHVHEQWGLKDSTQLECLMNGADGVWAGLCEEGAAMGHSCSTVMLLNLIRLGNKKVLKNYNCTELRRAAQNVTRITTGLEPHPKQPVYGVRAVDMVFGIDQFALEKNEFNLAEFFGEEPIMRITTLASPGMIVTRLTRLFGEDPQFTEERAKRMLEVMLEDLHANRKEEYMSRVGLAMLFDRSGGDLTEKMREIIAATELKSGRHQELLDAVREMWNEWDLREGDADDCLNFDSFYNGFMAPYFGCYRCDETKLALKAIDMDNDETVDWNEFVLYLKWALKEFPEIADTEELLSTAFRKGLIPAMQEELMQSMSA